MTSHENALSLYIYFLTITEILGEAITSNQVGGPLYDIMRFLLKAVFRVQEEDDLEWRTDLEEQGLEVPKGKRTLSVHWTLVINSLRLNDFF